MDRRHRRPSSGQGSSGSIVRSPFYVSSTTGIVGLGLDVDGGIVGRGWAVGAICPKGSASQSMTAEAGEDCSLILRGVASESGGL